MPSLKRHSIEHPHFGTVIVTRHPRARRFKMQWRGAHELRITMPNMALRRHAEIFLFDNEDWAHKHRPEDMRFTMGDRIGRYHRVLPSGGSTVRLGKRGVLVPSEEQLNQEYESFLRAAHNALRRECNQLILPRVQELLGQFDMEATITFKRQRSRWGSCSSKHNLNFNLYLVQLPDELIDYVILHEITHLTHMDHSKAFWKLLSERAPDVNRLRRELRQHQLELIPNPNP